MIVVEINYRDASNVAQTALFCNGLGFHTLPTDTPANATVLPYLTDAGFFQRDMFAGSAVAGAVKAGDRVGLLGIGSGLNCLMLALEW